MGDYLGARLPEDNCTEVVIRVMVGEHEPSDAAWRNGPDGAQEGFAVPRAALGIDDDDAGLRDDESGVGPTLGTAAGVAHDRVDPVGEPSQRK